MANGHPPPLKKYAKFRQYEEVWNVKKHSFKRYTWSWGLITHIYNVLFQPNAIHIRKILFYDNNPFQQPPPPPPPPQKKEIANISAQVKDIEIANLYSK